MKKYLLSLFFIFTISSLTAQDSNKELLKKLVEKNVLTQDEANEIEEESQKEKQADIIESTSAKVKNIFGNTPYLQIGGYGLLLYRYSNTSNTHNDLSARVIFLHAEGKLTNNFSYFIMGEFVNPALTEFYGNWSPAKAFSLRAGQFKVPISLENPISLTTLETIYYARSISALAGMGDDVLQLQNGKNNLGRDIGVQVAGSLFPVNNNYLVDYKIGLFQGGGINSSDKNNTKDFAGIIMLRPTNHFQFGGSAYFGQATYKMPNNDKIADHVRNRWLISAEYKTERFNSRAEWLHGNDGGIKKEGLYGLIQWYFIPNKLNAMGKIDYYNQNKDTNSEVMDYTIALNYYFYNKCRFQLNYTYSDYSAKWSLNAKNTNLVAAQMQIVF